MSGRTLIVTNDFPPRTGGIESFVLAMAQRMPPDSVVVHTARQDGDAVFDATLPFPVVRDPSRLMVPTPGVSSRVAETARGLGCDRVWFGAAAPLGLMAPALRRAGVRRTVATAHGHEIWWASVPVTRPLIRAIGERNDVVTYLGEYCRRRISAALSPAARSRMQQLTPGVDDTVFRPGAGGAAGRERHGLGDRRVPWSETPAYYDAGDVFCMPTRTRLYGLEPEALGICYLEAAACGLPVVAGSSGGAPDAVLDGENGVVVDGRSVSSVADAVSRLLLDRLLAQRFGEPT